MANTTAAIMALPTPLDSIRLVGDEEKHATLLFFGETSTLPGEARQTLLDSVAMACKMLSPFGESVIDVVRLGSDIPPALVALLTGNNLSQVRNLFLMNPAVKGYQDNVQQHPSFTPHVTLGHPDFTDEAILRALMRQIFRVRFDRLSVWWNDERFDCPLWAEGKDAPMSEAVGNFLAKHAAEDEDHLEHHGVKGQKWGVRKSDALGVSNLATKGTSVITMPSKAGGAKPSLKSGNNVALATHNIAKQLTNKGVNSGQIWAGIHEEVVATTGSGSKLTAKNMPVVNEIVARRLSAAANQFASKGTTARVMVTHSLSKELNPSGRPSLHLIVAKNKSDVDAYVAKTKQSLNGDHAGTDANKDWIVHADLGGELEVLELEPIVDANGFIIGIKDPDLAHAVDAVLAHHGIKGQKWGVRRKVDAGTGLVTKSDHTVKVNLKTGEQKVKGALFGGEARRLQKHLNDGGQLDLVTGKTGLTPRTGSEDQIHQDRIASKIASGGVHTLSNADIQAYSRRLQLTKDLDRALSEQSAATKAKSDGFIKSFVKKQGSRQIDRVANKAIDVAVEQAIAKSGVKLSGGKLKDFDKSTQSKSAFGDNLQIVAGRLAPKKGK